MVSDNSLSGKREDEAGWTAWTAHASATTDTGLWALEGRSISEKGTWIAETATSAWVRKLEKKAWGKWMWKAEGETGSRIAIARTEAWVRKLEKKTGGIWMWALEGGISETGTHTAIASIAIATTSAWERKIEEERVQVQQSHCNSSVPQVQGGTILQWMREMWCWRCLAARQLVGAVHAHDRSFWHIYWHSWPLLHEGGSVQGVGSFCLGSETGAYRHGENYSNSLFHLWMDQSIQSNFLDCAGTLLELTVRLNCFNCNCMFYDVSTTFFFGVPWV